ncbi:UDP-N-acetylmuramate--L-alanine ligase [bacterium]|nr:UDP-N-acetylmuramate--L-alanine ligase [bacterium]
MFGKIKHIHFIGIGGIGMSGIAELLNHWGFAVTGSDVKYSDNVARLEKSGIRIFIGHHAENLQKCDAVVYTSAVDSSNPESNKALKLGIPIIKRAEVLGEILRLRPNSIAIAGTHGKTTTTSLIGHMFTEAGLDPIIISGGVIKGLGSNIRIGSGDTIIVEADEFDHSFLQLYPTHIIITSIDPEHLDIYKTLENIKANFIKFANRVPFYGKLIVNAGDENIRSILSKFTVPTLQYSLDKSGDIRAENLHLSKTNSQIDIVFKEKCLGTVNLPLPGLHNVENALSAIAVGLEYDIDFSIIKNAIETFKGVERRFDIIHQSDELMLVDDYAHHPGEIKATLTAAKQGWDRRIIAVFQPHLYSRTKVFYKEFAQALHLADIIILLDVFPAREKPIYGVSGKLIDGVLRTTGHSNVHYFQKMSDVPDFIKSIYRNGDMIITLGAGDVNKLHKPFKEILCNHDR